MLRDKLSRIENLREGERERERQRLKAREDRGKGDRKLLISALDELRAAGKEPASKHLPPPSPGDGGLKSGDRYEPLNSFQVSCPGLNAALLFVVPRASPCILTLVRCDCDEEQTRSHSDIVSYQARNKGFKGAKITPASALSGFMGALCLYPRTPLVELHSTLLAETSECKTRAAAVNTLF